jgi:hypothetical protein
MKQERCSHNASFLDSASRHIGLHTGLLLIFSSEVAFKRRALVDLDLCDFDDADTTLSGAMVVDGGGGADDRQLKNSDAAVQRGPRDRRQAVPIGCEIRLVLSLTRRLDRHKHCSSPVRSDYDRAL